MLGRSAAPFQDLLVKCDGKTFRGRAVAGPSWLKHGNPVVLCFPDVMGCKAIDMYRCLHLSRVLGCAAVAVDLYGDEFPRQKREDRAFIHEAFTFMNDLLSDPVRMRRLMRAYVEEAVSQLNGDPNRVGAVGFCFGGTCVLEMIRDGAPVQVGVSMHGCLDGNPIPRMDGKPLPPMQSQKPAPTYTKGAHLLVCHGSADPLVPPHVFNDFMIEMSKAPLASCTVSSYINVVHAFTAPTQEAPNAVIAFNHNAARRAWTSAFDLFAQVFGVTLKGEVPNEFWTDVLVLPRL